MNESRVQRAVEWNTLRSQLAVALDCLEDDHHVVLQTRGGGDYYVQFAALGSEGLRAEAVSNRFLEEWEQVDRAGERRLQRLGWRPPTDIGDGPDNWWVHLDANDASRAADL